MKTIADIPTPLLLEQVAPVERPDRLTFHIIDPAAFAAFCARHGHTVESYNAHLDALFTPREEP